MKNIKKLLIYSRNPGKIREIKEILSPLKLEIRSIDEVMPSMPTPVESGSTFEENAIIKARAAYQATNWPVIADDSGLVVDYLGGEPGIFSARYAGVEGPDRDRANRKMLLSKLEGVPMAERTARFVCSVCLKLPDKEEIFTGICEGLISLEELGENGFGYDPIFFLPSENRTFAQLSPEEKNRYSHRADALFKLKKWLSKNS